MRISLINSENVNTKNLKRLYEGQKVRLPEPFNMTVRMIRQTGVERPGFLRVRLQRQGERI